MGLLPPSAHSRRADHGVLQLVAFIAGFILQNIYVTLWVGLAGSALAFLIVVPPYPFYNRSPESWLPGKCLAGTGIEIDGKKIN